MKFQPDHPYLDRLQSPPSRGAWIEILVVDW